MSGARILPPKRAPGAIIRGRPILDAIKTITPISKDDLLDVALDRYDHLIRHPRQIVVNQIDGSLTSVAVVDADGARQIVTMKTPLALPAPSATASPR
jgi:hypothetical protein